MLPLLDLREYHDPARRDRFIAALRTAAREAGFFHLHGHGVDPALAARVLELGRGFFALPEEEKLEIRMENTRHFRGYTRVGSERTGGRVDWREQIDVGLEQPALEVSPADPPWRRLPGPNQWPRRPAGLREAVLAWHEALQPVADALLRAFAISLGQPEDVFDECTRGLPNQVVKLIRYPGRAPEEGDQGCGAHKDGEFLTLLLQDQVGGLEVMSCGEWMPVPPRADCFVVNTGELLELASNGYYCATLHRVRAPPPGVERLSLAFFHASRLGATVPCLPLSPELAREARGVTRDPANPLFRQVGENTLKGRLRSHPEVARRFYADVVATAD